jgi:2-polyprenyl-6-methoxyphenol hydroxylase-like FAD-dependent oxidoreductase
VPKAIVIGAGIAGTATALALRRAGWEPEVHEAYAHSSGLAQGVFLTLAVNGLDALAAMGAEDAVSGLGFETGRIRFRSHTGKDLGSLPIGPRTPDGRVTRTVRRAALYEALYARVLECGIPVHHGHRLVDAREGTGEVVAIFDDRSTAAGDVLVGADGLRSHVRRVIDPDAPAPRDARLGNIGGVARRVDDVEPTGGDYVMTWGRSCFFGYTVSPDGEVWWFANPPARAGVTAANARERLGELLAADAGPAAAIVAATDGPILVDTIGSLPPVPHWTRSRLVLAGDAAHAVSPSTGQGASLALEDAATLGECLAADADVETALTAYVVRRRGRTQRIAAWGRRQGSTKTAGPVGRVLRDAILPRALAWAGSPKAQAKQAWIFEHHLEPIPEVAAR